MDESRKAFEQWVVEYFTYPFSLESNERGSYASPHTAHYWSAWKASRAAIEIKLDDKVVVEDDFDSGHNCAIDYCAESIRAAGIKVKE